MSLKQSFLSAFRVMNFVVAERAWRALSAEADFRVGKELPGKNILIIAPHPDDEVFGAFAALQKTEEHNNLITKERKNRRTEELKIIYLFAGDKEPKSEKAKIREEESKDKELQQFFFRLPDNTHISKNVITKIAEIIAGAEIIFLPSFSDPNIDHRESVRATVEALKIATIKNHNLKNIQIWLYEIWNPLPYFNRLIEIDWCEKQKAMAKFTSQKSERNYIKAIKFLNEYRGEIYGLGKPAEAFFAIPADLLVKLYRKE